MVTLAALLILFVASVVAIASAMAFGERQSASRRIAEVVVGVSVAALVLTALFLWWFLSGIHIG